MPRSSPSTSYTPSRVVEVVELDRDAPGPAAPEPRPNRWAILGGIVVLALAGLSLLPATGVEPEGADATLPDPAVATTLVGSSQPRLAFVSDETFPIFVASGLKGFASLTEPVFFDDRWWIVGNPPRAGQTATVLSAEDGRIWAPTAEIGTGGEASTRVDQLTTHDGTLIAVGTEGTTVGPDFYSALTGDLALWRSGNGIRWVKETVDAGSSSVAFTETRLATSGQSLVVQASVDATAPALAASNLPEEVVPALVDGRFSLWPQGTRLVVVGPLGIQLAETALGQVFIGPVTRLYRSGSYGNWEEIDIHFNVSGPVVAAPEGGFVVGTGGTAFTSAYGVNWAPNPRIYEATSYRDWGEGIMGLRFGLGSQIIDLIDEGEKLSVRLPLEMGQCSVAGSNGLLAAACEEPPAPRPRAVMWNGFELSVDGPWLELRTSETADVRQFRVRRAGGEYDPATNAIALVDSRGRSLAIPLANLELLDSGSSNTRFGTMLSADGLVWAQSQIDLRASEVALLGGINDGYLIATRSPEPNATFTVLAAEF